MDIGPQTLKNISLSSFWVIDPVPRHAIYRLTTKEHHKNSRDIQGKSEVGISIRR
jgi:hypothetical protein